MESVSCPAGYKLLSPIAKGRMGTVYKAYQISMDRKVAIKFLLPELTSDHKVVERFLQEARAVARLHHTGIVQGFDCGKCSGMYYLIMEYVKGTPLDRVIEKNDRLMEKWALFIALQVARALHHANRRGIIHRDLKPANIIIDKKGRAKLTDFGLARLLKKSPNYDVPMTELDELIGTPCYMAPEQILGYQQLDTRCDIYALGIILYHMITGQVPFMGMVGEILNKHLYEPMPDPRELASETTTTTCDIIQKMTGKRPEGRYQSPRELILALTDIYNKLEWPSSDETVFKDPGKSSDDTQAIRVVSTEDDEEDSMISGDDFGGGIDEPPPLPDDEDEEEADGEVIDLGEVGDKAATAESEEVPAGAEVYLVGDDGRGAGIRYKLTPGEKVGIGRDSAFCRLPLLDPLVSRLHCTVTFDGTRVHVEDAGSQNGTFVGARQIDSACLRPGSTLKIGSTVFKLDVE